MKIKVTRKRSPLAKAFAEPPSVQEEVEFRKLMVVEELLQFMKRHDLKRTDLAERMGVRPSRITAMLDGTSNLTIETLVRAGRAVGAELQQTFVSKGRTAHWFEADLADSPTQTPRKRRKASARKNSQAKPRRKAASR